MAPEDPRILESFQEGYKRALAQDAARHTGVTLQALSEFHERLKRNVAKLTCDVEQSPTKFAHYISTLDRIQLEQLATVLRGELLQVIKAVDEAK